MCLSDGFKLPSLLNLQILEPTFYAGYTKEDVGSMADADVTNGGLELECLEIFRTRCPLLRKLVLAVVASDVLTLSSSMETFTDLEHLELFSSFYNFKRKGFSMHEAAKYTSAFLPKGCKFLFTNDRLLAQEKTGKDHWLNYLKPYRGFSDQFRLTVTSYMDIRADEGARTYRKLGVSV